MEKAFRKWKFELINGTNVEFVRTEINIIIMEQNLYFETNGFCNFLYWNKVIRIIQDQTQRDKSRCGTNSITAK